VRLQTGRPGLMRTPESISLDVVLFFQQNPSARETVQSISLRIGPSPEVVEHTLERLVEQSILTRRGTGQTALYCYQRPYLNVTA